MSYTKSNYAYRGQRLRRIDRIRKTLIVVVLLGIVALLPREHQAVAEASTKAPAAFPFGIADARRMHAELDATKSQLQLAQAQLDRANAVMQYSATYKVSADLAGAIYDVALAEGIEPDLGFRLVRVESEFHDHATSPVGALGLTQVMPATATHRARRYRNLFSARPAVASYDGAIGTPQCPAARKRKRLDL